jgi:hypothetical protein
MEVNGKAVRKEPGMNVTDEMIEAAALSDAEFDGRNFMCMGRVDRDRYILRAKASLAAALSLAPQVKKTPSPETKTEVQEGNGHE